MQSGQKGEEADDCLPFMIILVTPLLEVVESTANWLVENRIPIHLESAHLEP